MTAAMELEFDSIARLPAAGDNVAIATERLAAGVRVRHRGSVFALSHDVLEGHRFASAPVAAGSPLLSWGLPFGIATRDILPGEYACNEKILRVLAERDVGFALPAEPNFRDYLQPHGGGFSVGQQVAPAAVAGGFEGFRRSGGRGVGTRNVIVILATTSRTAAFAERLAASVRGRAASARGVDGVCAVTHTEGGGERRPHNLEFVLRTLAGFMVHPNVAAVLAVDDGAGAFDNRDLERYARDNRYPLDHVRHRFATLAGDAASELAAWERVVVDWLGEADGAERTVAPLGALKIALQCGGSDAFSGVSGNALAGWVAKELLRHGGSANLAETDELIGAEPYVLANVRDADTARAFLHKIEVFKERARHHGASAEGNPSGGNNYRGLYNIALKSIGAARKKDPDVRLDHVIDYGAPMTAPGYYFMDSPGNDLESIAGQVASGANLILFITGNGSITNFPFVPTLKFVTTTGRFGMLSGEMDVNAGRYNDGLPMEQLGRETFDLMVRVASGQRSKGETAGHAQVQIWRDWPRTDASGLDALRAAPEADGRPLAVVPGPPAKLDFEALAGERGPACDQVGLIMPTSLCSGQIARLIADRLNRQGHPAVSRFVALVHTEGCGSANTETLYLRTLLGHLRHRCTRRALLLEHGCEKTHNDAVRHYLVDHGLDPSRLGWASVQLDGGITSVASRVSEWFVSELGDAGPPERVEAHADALRLALASDGPIGETLARGLGRLVRGIVNGGGTVVVGANASVARSREFLSELVSRAEDWRVTLEYGAFAERPGLHVMATPTEDPVETLTGLGATGSDVMLAHVGRTPLQAHPMIPLLQVSGEPAVVGRYAADLDVALDPHAAPDAVADTLLRWVGSVASRAYLPKLFAGGNTGFQLSRGPLGLSL